jgi:hypothetical protein
MLEKPGPCKLCPGYSQESHTGLRFSFISYPCNICRKFVDTEGGCPCANLGEKEAIKRTCIAIEEYEDKVNENKKRRKL